VPTIAETLAPGYEAAGWTGLVAPGRHPARDRRRASAPRWARCCAQPALEARILAMGGVPDPGTPEGFGRFVRDEIAKWREVARAGNVRLEG
jgi:tripartite-type tricarboxylate transporter receptor subunit TctC